MTKQERLDIVRKEVQSPININAYNNDTRIRDNTNAMAYAIGATFPYLPMYRLGAISDSKSLDEPYYSTQELVNLLYKDLDVLGLKYEKIFDDEAIKKIDSNQYIIKLYALVFADGQIGDFYFIRYDNGKWTEKRKRQRVIEMYDCHRYDRDWMYQHLITLKITRKG